LKVQNVSKQFKKMETQEEIIQKLLKEKLKGQQISNSDAKNEWWKSILKFISGGIIAILTGFATNYPKTSQLETKIITLEKNIDLLKAENDSVKILNNKLKFELKKISKTETKQTQKLKKQ
jgi:hypothetical protein